MTVSEAIINWLKGFTITGIDTEKQSAEANSYSLAKEPIQSAKPYLSGKVVYTDHYTIQARLSTDSNTEMIENNSIGENLEDWIREQTAKGNFPVLKDNLTCKWISVTTPFYMGKMDEHTAVYQLTIAIKYEKESVKK